MMLEQFVYREDVLKRLSSHCTSGKPLPAAEIAKIAGAKQFLSALTVRRMLAFAYFDMAVHSGLPPYTFRGQSGLGFRELWEACQRDIYGIAPPPNTHYASSWYHLVIG